MKHISVFAFITAIFSLAIASIILTFSLFLHSENRRLAEVLHERYAVMAQTTLWQMQLNPNENELKQNWKLFHFDWINNPKIMQSVLETNNQLAHSKFTNGSMRIFLYDEDVYLYLRTDTLHILLKDKRYKPRNILMALSIFIVVFIILVALYVVTIKKLRPLKRLNVAMQDFANGDFDRNVIFSGSDEIAEVANSFNYVVSQIRSLINSRSLFMRNIMHELKTPIAKGMISAEMVKDVKHKDRLLRVFKRLNELINTFADIEQINLQHLNSTDVTLKELFNGTSELLMMDEIMVDYDYSNATWSVDREYFTIALKNLIENGLRYSKDSSVLVRANSTSICVENHGEVLDHTLSYYTRPFIQGEDKQGGFGLGLYIVEQIVNAHGLAFEYSYRGDTSYFCIRREV